MLPAPDGTQGPRTVAVVPVWVKEVSVSVIEVAVGLVRVIAVAVVSVTAPVSVSVTAVTAVSVGVMGGLLGTRADGCRWSPAPFVAVASAWLSLAVPPAVPAAALGPGTVGPVVAKMVGATVGTGDWLGEGSLPSRLWSHTSEASAVGLPSASAATGGRAPPKDDFWRGTGCTSCCVAALGLPGSVCCDSSRMASKPCASFRYASAIAAGSVLPTYRPVASCPADVKTWVQETEEESDEEERGGWMQM